MKQIIQKGIYTLFALSLLLPSIVVIAQEAPIEDQPVYTSGLNSNNLKGGDLGNCNDYYGFSNIDVNITQDKVSYEPGDPIILSGQIVNNRNFSLPNITVTARLVKEISNQNETINYISIDEFDIVNDVNLAKGSSQEINKIYELSTLMSKGKYELQFFVKQNKQFTLSGDNNIAFQKTSFEMSGDNVSDTLYLDKTRVTIDGKSSQEWQKQENKKTENIEISIPLKNSLDIEQIIDVNYRVYTHNVSKEQTSEVEEVIIPAKGEIVLKRTVSKLEDIGYTLKIEAKPVLEEDSAQWQKTLAYIELLSQSLPRLDHLGLTAFPKQKGESGYAITCITGSGEGYTIEMNITDRLGRNIANSIYNGDIQSNKDAILTQLPVNKAYGSIVNIKTTIKDNAGVIVDEADIVYDCNEINPDTCITDGGQITYILGIVLLIGIICLGIFAIYLQRKTIRKLLIKKK